MKKKCSGRYLVIMFCNCSGVQREAIFTLPYLYDLASAKNDISLIRFMSRFEFKALLIVRVLHIIITKRETIHSSFQHENVRTC